MPVSQREIWEVGEHQPRWVHLLRFQKTFLFVSQIKIHLNSEGRIGGLPLQRCVFHACAMESLGHSSLLKKGVLSSLFPICCEKGKNSESGTVCQWVGVRWGMGQECVAALIHSAKHLRPITWQAEMVKLLLCYQKMFEVHQQARVLLNSHIQDI